MAEHVDLRVVKTREAIEGAFVELLQQKPFEHITVQDILDAARVNRKTFYKHYADKYALADLLIERQEDMFQSALEERFDIGRNDYSLSTALQTFYEKMYASREQLLALYEVRTERHYLREELKGMLKKTYCERFAVDDAVDADSMTVDYLSDSYAATALSSIKWFLEVDDEAAIDIIVHVAEERQSSPLYGFMSFAIPKGRGSEPGAR